ncbi:hypothetical protein [Persephonella sp.]
MKKVIKGNIKFTKPVVEKLLDIYYIKEKDGKDLLEHSFKILSYSEFDRDIGDIANSLQKEGAKLVVIEQTVLVNFGDEDIQRRLDTEIYYDEEWIKKFNPDYDNFESWIINFIDNTVFESMRCKE